jgi:hypothetical protein
MNKKNTMPSYLVELEHELAAALRKVDEQRELLRLCKEENDEKHKDIIWCMGERAKLMERIERLEEAGDGLLTAMRDDWSEYVDWIDETTDAISKWNKAKEAKP